MSKMSLPKTFINIGILGCSKIARKAVLPAIIDAKNAKIGRIGSRNIDKAKQFCKEFNCTSWGDYDDVLNDSNVDLVYVSLPNALHEEWVIKAAKRGKHIWCEKPSTTNYQSAKKMVSICKMHSVRLFEGFMYQFHPQHSYVKKTISNNQLGRLLNFDGKYCFPYPDTGSNLMNKSLGGGVLNDSASYPIHACRFIFQEEPISVFCKMQYDDKLKIDIKADLILFFPKGKTAYILSSFGSYYQCYYTILGSEASLTLSRAYVVPKGMQTFCIYDKQDTKNKIKMEVNDHFKLMIENYCKIIMNEHKAVFDSEDDLLAQARVLEAARKSNMDKRLVGIEEIT